MYLKEKSDSVLLEEYFAGLVDIGRAAFESDFGSVAIKIFGFVKDWFDNKIAIGSDVAPKPIKFHARKIIAEISGFVKYRIGNQLTCVIHVTP